MVLVAYFIQLQEKLPLFPGSEIKVRVAPRKFRVIDFAVYAGEEPTQAVPEEVPQVAIEIVSPDDKGSRKNHCSTSV